MRAGIATIEHPFCARRGNFVSLVLQLGNAVSGATPLVRRSPKFYNGVAVLDRPNVV